MIETATKVIAGIWGDEGSSRIQHSWVADPGIARRLATGQAGYIHAGTCTWICVARPRPAPAAPTRPPARPVIIPPAAANGHRTRGDTVPAAMAADSWREAP